MDRHGLTWNLLCDQESHLMYQAARDVQARVVATHGAPAPPSKKTAGRPVKRSRETQQEVLDAWDAYVSSCRRSGRRPMVHEFAAQAGIPLRSFNELRRSRPRIRGW
jgi:hypothetical protein